MKCPCCGGAMAQVNVSVLKGADFATVPRSIVNCLATAYPAAVPAEALLDNIYSGVRNGGPVHARQALSVQINRLRDRLAIYGWTIPIAAGGRGNVASYRLSPLERTVAKTA